MATTSAADRPDLELRDVHESEKLVPYLRDLWGRREYIWYVSANELRSRQVNNVLGNLWHLLNPLLTIGVYFVIFGLLLDVGSRSADDYMLFLSAGLFTFSYTQKATIDGAKSIVKNIGLIRAVKFPRAMLPITSTLTETIASWSSFAVLYLIAFITNGDVDWRWLVLPAFLFVQFFFNMGSSMVAARMTTHFRDTTQILPFVFRLLLYGSGVIFNLDSYNESGNKVVEWLFTLNPMFCFIEMARWCVMDGRDLDVKYLISACVWSFLMFTLGFLWFRAAEERYARG